MPVLPFEGILKPEAMLRQAQAEVTELRKALEHGAMVLAQLESRLQTATLSFCAAAVQAGGVVTVTRDELDGTYSLKRHEDPATHAVTWTVTRQEQPAVQPAVEPVQ
jgi:hypothetical protein